MENDSDAAIGQKYAELYFITVLIKKEKPTLSQPKSVTINLTNDPIKGT